MSLKSLAAINWEALTTKSNCPDVKRSVAVLRAKANEIMAKSEVYMKEPEAIPFDTYKSKLKFTSAAVDSLAVSYP